MNLVIKVLLLHFTTITKFCTSYSRSFQIKIHALSNIPNISLFICLNDSINV